ncbi:ATP-dependent 6-phosphofructokinase subunit alpha, partial [Dissostichus eleginoides]
TAVDSMATLEPYSGVIEDMSKKGMTYDEIALNLSENGIGRGCSTEILDQPTYGRKMMKGYLAAQGIDAAETRVGK